MSEPLTEADLARFLARALAILNAMAEEGMGFRGMEDPADILFEFTQRLGLDDWDAARATLEPAE